MKVAILAGGRGSRLGHVTSFVPKPLIEVCERPIICHVMEGFAQHGFRDFYLALGYKGEQVRRFFTDKRHQFAPAGVKFLQQADSAWSWNVRPLETGLDTATAGRVKRLRDVIGRETFMLAWCDGLADINFQDLLAFHRSHGRIATLAAVHPPGRYGHITLDSEKVVSFNEKPPKTHEWINGGFFVLEPEIFSYIDGDESDWETETIQRLVRSSQLMAFRHESFWQCMDTPRDKECLEVFLRNRASFLNNSNRLRENKDALIMECTT